MLSIVALVLVIRTLLIPLFVRQIKASRQMQIIQPELKKVQDKYKGKTDQASREAMTKETMELYKSSKTNPFASCLPILLQMPIFFALFRVLNGIRTGDGIGPFTADLVAGGTARPVSSAPSCRPRSWSRPARARTCWRRCWSWSCPRPSSTCSAC